MSKIEHIENSLIDEIDELGMVEKVNLAPAETKLLQQASKVSEVEFTSRNQDNTTMLPDDLVK